AAVIDDVVAAEADFMRVTAISSAPVALLPSPAAPAGPAVPAGPVGGRALSCAGDPDLFFAETPDDGELSNWLFSDSPPGLACLAGAVERRERWGVWGGELFIRGEIVPRKRGRGRPRKTDVAA